MRALTRPLVLVAALAAAAFAAPPGHADYCAGTANVGKVCVAVSTGSHPSATVQEQSDCVYVVVGDCVPVTYWVVRGVDPGGPYEVRPYCTGVFAFSAHCT